MRGKKGKDILFLYFIFFSTASCHGELTKKMGFIGYYLETCQW